MNQPTQRQIERANDMGHAAGVEGKPYGSNPFSADRPQEKLAWSQGHNAGRVQMIKLREELA
jgi:ribosome modulation factor